MRSKDRKTLPNSISYVLEALRSSDRDLTVEEACKILQKTAKYKKGLAELTLKNSIKEGILITDSKSVPFRKQIIRLPTLDEFRVPSHDWYCFECHLPGKLENCSQCPRSFHRTCYRSTPETPNYEVPSSRSQKFPHSEFGQNSTIISNTDLNSSTVSELSTTSIQEENNTEFPIDEYNALKEQKTSYPSLSLSYDDKGNLNHSKYNFDVICLGQTRPPRRKEVASLKNETCANGDTEIEATLCTCCRLRRKADLSNPANVGPKELCYYAFYCYDYNRSWMDNDVLAIINKLAELDPLFIRLCIYFPITDAIILSKLKNHEYMYLNEVLIDILNMQHMIALYYGCKTEEYRSTQYFVGDFQHGMLEIRRCSDCYRHSIEQTEGWFCKPCLQRHELVYAKYRSYSYWPAKVIQVLSNGKYDVRFFGGLHTRALVDSKFIKPIETELTLSKKPRLVEAMKELHHHQALRNHSPTLFSFEANKEIADKIIKSVLNDNYYLSNNFDLNSNDIYAHSPAKRARLSSNLKSIIRSNESTEIRARTDTLNRPKKHVTWSKEVDETYIIDESDLDTDSSNSTENIVRWSDEVDPTDSTEIRCGLGTDLTNSAVIFGTWSVDLTDAREIRSDLDTHSSNSTENIVTTWSDEVDPTDSTEIGFNLANNSSRSAEHIIVDEIDLTDSTEISNFNTVPVSEIQNQLSYDAAAAKELMRQDKKLIEELTKENNLLKEQIAFHNQMLEDIKRKHWCNMCFSEIACTSNYRYCSKKCEKNHFQEKVSVLPPRITRRRSAKP